MTFTTDNKLKLSLNQNFFLVSKRTANIKIDMNWCCKKSITLTWIFFFSLMNMQLILTNCGFSLVYVFNGFSFACSLQKSWFHERFHASLFTVSDINAVWGIIKLQEWQFIYTEISNTAFKIFQKISCCLLLYNRITKPSWNKTNMNALLS